MFLTSPYNDLYPCCFNKFFCIISFSLLCLSFVELIILPLLALYNWSRDLHFKWWISICCRISKLHWHSYLCPNYHIKSFVDWESTIFAVWSSFAMRQIGLRSWLSCKTFFLLVQELKIAEWSDLITCFRWFRN
jgi:hypothetical protein